MNCSKCNAWVPEDSAFCPECGQKIEAPAPVETPVEAPVAAEPEKVFCHNCGAVMAPGDSFCDNCGAKMATAPEAVPAEKAAAFDVKGTVDSVKGAVQKLNIPPKFLKLGAAAVALILVVVIVISLFSGPKLPNSVLYLKDNELFYGELPKLKDPMEITSNLAEDVSASQMADVSYIISYLTQFSEDGEKLFYPDKIDEDGYTLYCRDLTSSKDEPIKIDSGLTSYSYSVNAKGNLVTYMKDGKLYQHDLKEKTKIASDVYSYRISEDGKTILYLVWEEDEEAGTLYLKKGNKDGEKIASDVTELVHVDEDVKTFLYMKEEDLYKQKGTKDPEKIASDVSDVLTVYEDGSLYYTSSEEEKVSYWDLFEDDMEEVYGYDSSYMKEWMSDSYINYPFQTLNYYNGKESKVVCESMVDWEDYAIDEAVVVYAATESTDLPQWKLSEYYEEGYDIYDKLQEYVEEDCTYYVAAKDSSNALDLEDVRRIYISDDGKTLYASADFDSKDYIVTLYKMTLNGSKIKKTDKLDEDVYASYISTTEEGSVVYFKEVEDREGELYMDGKHIDDDVYTNNVTIHEDTLYYFVDWDSEDRMGTLKYSNGKKAESVKDDVHTFVISREGEVVFLYDYDTDDYTGEMWILDGKKAVKLMDDVIALIPIV